LNKNMKAKRIAKGTITTPKGFVASGVHAGIKQNRPDVSLIMSTQPAVAAATFTRNTAKAWPVLWSMKAMRNRTHRAIIANSGNANCFNGEGGRRAVETTVKALAKAAKIGEKEILISSTGIIGEIFPIKKVLGAISALLETLSKSGGHKAAQGILTTDRVTKEYAVSLKLGKETVRIGGIAKGSGMMNPNMATMLCYLTTDAAIAKPLLAAAVKTAVQESFNRISIDTDTSTNDTVYMLANGMAGNRVISSPGKDYKAFLLALLQVMRYLAKELVKDGEGVKHIAEIHVAGTKNDKDADRIARTLAHSMLFKTMLAGEDPNWGRVVASVGSTGIAFDPNKLDISFSGKAVLHSGKVIKKNIAAIRKQLAKPETRVDVNLNLGKGEALFLTSDLTTAYVRINSWYHT